MRHLIAFALAALTVPALATAQGRPPWTVVRFPNDETFTAKLVSLAPAADCGKCDEPPSGPAGLVKVTRDEQQVTIDVDLKGLPAKPGRYYLYTVDDRGRTTKIAEFGTKFAKTLRLPAAENEAFMLVVSAQDDLTRMPPRNKLMLYSAAPRDLTVLPRP
jgi:hypothetical protein